MSKAMKIEEMPVLENCILAHPTPGEEVLPDFVQIAPEREESKAAQSITYDTNSGNNFVYSDNPEYLSTSYYDMHYLWGCSLGVAYKDVECYQVLTNGQVTSTAQCRVGVGVQNTTNSTVTIYYRSNGASMNNSSDASAQVLTRDVLTNFQNAGSSYLSTTISPYNVKYIFGITDNFAANTSKFFTIRGQLRSSLASGVYMRVFAAGSDTMNDMIKLFTPTTPIAGASPQFTGETDYTVKNALIAANTSDTWTLFAAKNLNPNEYNNVLFYKTGSNYLNYSAGNFGVKYNFTITNAANKKIWIVPNWSTPGRVNASLVFRINGGTWANTGTMTTGMGVYRALGSSSTATVECLLPGGNHGDWSMYFAN